MGGQLRETMFNQILAQNPQAITQTPYVSKPINTNVNPYPTVDMLFPNLNNQILLNKPFNDLQQNNPNNALNFLSSPNMQQNNQMSSGANRFAGLLGSPITYNTQGK